MNRYVSMSSPIAWEQSWEEPWLDLGLENHCSCCILDTKELGIKEKWKSGDNIWNYLLWSFFKKKNKVNLRFITFYWYMLTLQNNTFYYDSFMYVNSVADHIPHSSPTTPAAPVTLHDVPPPNFMLSSSYVFWWSSTFCSSCVAERLFCKVSPGKSTNAILSLYWGRPSPLPSHPTRQSKEPIDNGFHKVNSCIRDRSWSNCQRSHLLPQNHHCHLISGGRVQSYPGCPAVSPEPVISH